MQIDFTYLETVSDGDHEFIIEFISTFENTIALLIEKMEKELATNDLENLGRSAHQLKPSAKMVGLACANRLEELQNDPSTAQKDDLVFIHENCTEGLNNLKAWAKERGIAV